MRQHVRSAQFSFNWILPNLICAVDLETNRQIYGFHFHELMLSDDVFIFLELGVLPVKYVMMIKKPNLL